MQKQARQRRGDALFGCCFLGMEEKASFRSLCLYWIKCNFHYLLSFVVYCLFRYDASLCFILSKRASKLKQSSAWMMKSNWENKQAGGELFGFIFQCLTLTQIWWLVITAEISTLRLECLLCVRICFWIHLSLEFTAWHREPHHMYSLPFCIFAFVYIVTIQMPTNTVTILIFLPLTHTHTQPHNIWHHLCRDIWHCFCCTHSYLKF